MKKEDVRVGDMVFYRHGTTKRDVPALVLRVFEDGVVNLQVFFDHDNDLPTRPSTGFFTPDHFWRTSVTFSNRNVAGTWHFMNSEQLEEESA